MRVDNCDITTDPDSSKVSINLSPVAGFDTYGANCQIVWIDTNMPGYVLSIRANSDDGTNNLTYQNPTTLSPLPFIPAIDSSATPDSPAALTTGSWGFAVEDFSGFDSNYSTSDLGQIATNKFAELPTTDTLIADVNEMPESSDSYTFYYATRVDHTKPAGTYTTTITYTATGKIASESPIAMQAFSAQQCNSMGLHEIAKLYDTRDGQAYRVRKMDDGKCWMIDNLRLELIEDMVFTPDDSDVKTATTVNFNWRYYDDSFEEWVGFTGTREGDFVTWGELTKMGYPAGGYGFDYMAWRQVDPSMEIFYPDDVAAWGYEDWQVEAYYYCRPGRAAFWYGSLTGCGYFYNFFTATAGTSDDPSGNEQLAATGSICPAGWRLPITGFDYYGSDSDIALLNGFMNGDGAPSAESYDYVNNRSYVDNWLPSGAWQGAMGGRYMGGSIFNTGSNGSYWSATSGNYRGYMFEFNSSPDPDDPSSSIYMYYNFGNYGFGLPIRCMLR